MEGNALGLVVGIVAIVIVVALLALGYAWCALSAMISEKEGTRNE